MRKKTLRNFLSISLQVLLLMSPALARDNEQVGSVVALRGTVTAVNDEGTSRALSIKSPVFRHDILKTGPQGRIQVLFSDNTIISLGKDSQMEIEEHVWRPDQKTGAMKTRVKEGVFRVMGGAIAKEAPKSFTTETPAATIGIRGSMYAGRVTDGMLTVVFEGGRGIDVRNDAGQVSITRPGFGTRIETTDAPPERPTRFNTQEISDLNNDMAIDAPAQQDASSAPAQGSADGSSGENTSGTQASQDDQVTGSGEAGTQNTGDSGSQVLQENGTEGDTAAGSTVATGSGQELSSPPTAPAQTTSVASSPGTPTVPLDVQTVTQGRLTDQVTDQVLSSTPIDLDGIFMAAMVDNVYSVNANSTVWYTRNATATSTNGSLSGSATAQNNGTAFTFNLKVNPYNPNVSYSSPSASLIPQGRTVNLLGADRSFNMKMESDPLGECTIFSTNGLFTSAREYDYSEVGIFGPRVTIANLPTTGIDTYSGAALGYENLSIGGETWTDFSMGTMNMGVNWGTGKALGVMHFYDSETPVTSPEHRDPPVFFFGDLDRTTGTLTNLRCFGTRGNVEGDPANTMPWIEGYTGYAQFYGSAYQGFGFMGMAYDYNIFTNMTTTMGASQVTTAAFRQTPRQTIPSAQTGTASLSGFVVGVGENMSNPIAGRRIFMNADPSNFTLNLNRDLGTLSGLLSAADASNPNMFLSSIEIGQSWGSAYIHDHGFAALLGDTGDDGISSYAMSGGLKPYANYLITADPDRQSNEYLTWGYWEIAYTDPSMSAPYHVHHPGSLWVAGEITPPSAIQGLISNNVTATYTGGAHGTVFDGAGQMAALTNGVTNIIVDFNPAATQQIAGTIRFDQVQMNLQNGLIQKEAPSFTVPNSRFSADAVIGGSAAGAVNGAFYGPNANAVGGSFNATSGGTRYIGIFEGKRN